VTFDPTQLIDSTKLRQVLNGFNLDLQSFTSDSFLIVRLKQSDTELIQTSDEISSMGYVADIEEVAVTSSQYHLLADAGNSKMTLGQADLSARPAIGNDVSRLVNQLPGSATSGVSARPNVRGGNEDETLILFDGVTLYEPFHFNHFHNLFGSFDSRIVDSLHFHSGGFSTQYGDRLSAVMDIHSRNTTEILGRRELGLGLYYFSYLQAGGDTDKNWLLNARISSIGLISGLAESDLGDPKFADLFGRYSFNTAALGRLSVNLFWFGDDTTLKNSSGTEQASSLYGNTYIWIKSEREFSNRLYGETILGFSAIKNDRKGWVDKENYVTGALLDDQEFRIYNIKQDYGYLSDADSPSNWVINFGWDYRYLEAEYEFHSEVHIDPLFQQISNYDRPTHLDTILNETGHQLGLYGGFKWAVNNQLSAELGLRFDAQHYEHTNNASQLSPRANILFKPGGSTEIRLGFGKFTQAEGIHELKVSDGLNDFQQAQEATHLIAGINQKIFGTFNLRFEAYRKKGVQTNTYFQNLTNPLSLIPELQPDRYQVSPVDFESKGVELGFDGQWNEMNLWGNYSYSSIEDTVDAETIPRTWDQSHTINVGLSTHIYGWGIALTGTAHKGWRTTPLSLTEQGVITGVRNSLRFNNYSSLDVKFNRTWLIDGNQLRLEAGLTNIFNRKNQIGNEFSVADGELVSKRKYSLRLVPFFDIYWRF